MQNTRTFNRIPAVHTGTPSRRRVARKHSPYVKLAKKIFNRTKIHLTVYLTFFFIIPAFLPAGADNVLLTLVFPVISFFMTGVYGLRYGFIKHYLAIPTVLFILASFMNFQPFSFLYSLCYLLVGIIALAFGTIYRQACR